MISADAFLKIKATILRDGLFEEARKLRWKAHEILQNMGNDNSNFSKRITEAINKLEEAKQLHTTAKSFATDMDTRE